MVVPAAYVFLVREAPGATPEVLLQLRRHTGFMDDHWAAGAAGHVERGETAHDAARREAHEELGVADLDLTFELTLHRTAGGEPIDERVDWFFTARSWSGEPRIVEPEKCADLRWWPTDDVPRPGRDARGMVPHELLALGHLGSDVKYLTDGFDH